MSGHDTTLQTLTCHQMLLAAASQVRTCRTNTTNITSHLAILALGNLQNQVF